MDTFDDIQFPVIKNVKGKTIAHSLMSVKPATVEELAKGRIIKPYPYKYDDFADRNSLKEYLIDRFTFDKIFSKCKTEWLNVDTSSMLPINISKRVFYTSVSVISIDCTQPAEHILDDMRFGGSMVNLNPTKWSATTLYDIIDEIKNEWKENIQ